MHVQRVHYGKLAALLLVVTGLLLLIYRSLPDPRTSLIGSSQYGHHLVNFLLFLTCRCGGRGGLCGGCRGSSGGSTEFRGGAFCRKIPHLSCLSRTGTLSGEKSKLHKIFWAISSCILAIFNIQEVSQGWLTVSVFGRAVPGGTEYRGSLREEEWGLAVTVAGDGAWDSWDAAVCANASQPRGCLVTEAASNSFLFRGRADGPGLRRLHRLVSFQKYPKTAPEIIPFQTGAASPPPLTACANSDLSHRLAEAFDENRDGRLSAEVGRV